MSNVLDPARSTRTPAGLAIATKLCGAGVAGVPWAVFRYAASAGIGATAAWWLALLGIVGGVVVLLRPTPPGPAARSYARS